MYTHCTTCTARQTVKLDSKVTTNSGFNLRICDNCNIQGCSFSSGDSSLGYLCFQLQIWHSLTLCAFINLFTYFQVTYLQFNRTNFLMSIQAKLDPKTTHKQHDMRFVGLGLSTVNLPFLQQNTKRVNSHTCNML